MSFISSLEPEVESSQGNCSETVASAQSKLTGMRKQSSSRAKLTERSRVSLSSVTSGHSMLDPTGDVLTLFLEAFPVRTSAAQAIERESQEPSPDYGASSRGWFAKWNPSTSEWRTPQISLLEDSELFSETWPRWGSMRNGVSYLRPTLAHTICVSVSGSLLPTLTVNGNYNRPYPGKKSGYGLATAISLLPTLTTGGLNGGSNSRRATAKRGEPPTHIGPLNPVWAEWFMGFPMGWTALDALEMRKYLEWQQQHGGFSAEKAA